MCRKVDVLLNTTWFERRKKMREYKTLLCKTLQQNKRITKFFAPTNDVADRTCVSIDSIERNVMNPNLTVVDYICLDDDIQ